MEKAQGPDIWHQQTPGLAEAEKLLTAAIRQTPDTGPPRWSLGVLLARQERYMEALPHFAMLVAPPVADYRAYRHLGLIYDKLGQTGKSEEYLETYRREKRKAQVEKIARKEMEKQLNKFGQAGALNRP